MVRLSGHSPRTSSISTLRLFFFSSMVGNLTQEASFWGRSEAVDKEGEVMLYIPF
jgi:hypothetical protein